MNNKSPPSRPSALDGLKLLLHGADPLDSLIILEQIRSLIGDEDAELLLSLAVRAFVTGDEDRAGQYVAKAALAAPNDLQVKKAKLFFLVASDDASADEYCLQILHEHPNDSWVLELRKQIGRKEPRSLSLPAIDSRWERLILSE